jgi:predicted DNA-binding protein (UPF0251 family)
MPRPKRIRKVHTPPHFKGYLAIGQPEEHPVVLNFEEYEAIKLCDYLLCSQAQASIHMGVSRPTFTRIYESARRKVAQAFVHGSPIIFEGGKVYFDSEWFVCNYCGCWFNQPEKHLKVTTCALCGSSEIMQYNGNSILNNSYVENC